MKNYQIHMVYKDGEKINVPIEEKEIQKFFDNSQRSSSLQRPSKQCWILDKSSGYSIHHNRRKTKGREWTSYCPIRSMP